MWPYPDIERSTLFHYLFHSTAPKISISNIMLNIVLLLTFIHFIPFIFVVALLHKSGIGMLMQLKVPWKSNFRNMVPSYWSLPPRNHIQLGAKNQGAHHSQAFFRDAAFSLIAWKACVFPEMKKTEHGVSFESNFTHQGPWCVPSQWISMESHLSQTSFIKAHDKSWVMTEM